MRNLVFAAVMFHAAAASAQPAPDWRAILADLYRIDVAFDVCATITPAASDMLRLEGAIAYVEEKSSLEEDELDELYGEMERESAPLADFCARMSDSIARVQALPNEYR
jgi:hypothetical protein